MSTDEKAEIKEMIHDILAGYQALTESKLDLLNYKLDEMNNKVDSNEVKALKNEVDIRNLEIENLKHNNNCPQNSRIIEVEDFVKEHKNVKKFIYSSFAFASGAVVFIYYLIKLSTGI